MQIYIGPNGTPYCCFSDVIMTISYPFRATSLQDNVSSSKVANVSLASRATLRVRKGFYFRPLVKMC